MLNLGLIHEAIAAAIPEREALVFRDRRFSWRQLTDVEGHTGERIENRRDMLPFTDIYCKARIHRVNTVVYMPCSITLND